MTVDIQNHNDIKDTYQKMVKEAYSHWCPSELAIVNRQTHLFVDGKTFTHDTLQRLICGNHVVAVNGSPYQVLYLQPKCFDLILLIPKIFKEAYVECASELNRTNAKNVQDALNEGLMCGRSLLKVMKHNLYKDMILHGEETCLRYFLKNGIILSAPTPRFVKKLTWNERVPWYYNPFVVDSSTKQQKDIPQPHPGSFIQSKRLLFSQSPPADFFVVACTVLHEFCTPNTIHISRELSWGRCKDVLVIMQTSQLQPNQQIIYDLQEASQPSVYISVLASNESNMLIMSMAIEESFSQLMRDELHGGCSEGSRRLSHAHMRWLHRGVNRKKRSSIDGYI